MTRLTKDIKETLLKKLLVHAYKDRVQEAINANAHFAVKVYNDAFAKDLKQVNALPKGWLVTDTDITVQFGPTVQRLYFRGTLGAYSLSDVLRPCGAQIVYDTSYPFPANKKDTVVKQYDGVHPLVSEFDSLKAKFSDLETEIHRATKTIEAAMNSVTTVKKLIEVWPEVEEFAKPYLDQVPNLPSIPRQELNALLDLPPETAA